MKKINFLLIAFFFTLSSFSGAVYAGEKFEEPDQMRPAITDENSPLVFNQDFYPALKIEDSLIFRNSEIIVLEKSFRLKETFIENGIKHVVDTFLFVKKTIKPFTKGSVVKINRDSWNNIISMIIAFPSEDAEIYYFHFFSIEKEGWFILSGGGVFYNFRGKEYPLDVSTKGSSILMVEPPVKSGLFILE